ncbi:MAG: VWA domain-containing protein [candidate division Zixibacteria bacterium]|nr:VWA domain-containing protein [candidate division Zixibacteria bacterium]
MRFAEPIFLWGLLALPLLLLFFLWLERRRKKALGRIGDLEMVLRLLEGFSEKIRRWKYALVLLASAFVILALARPQWGKKMELVKREGLDIIVAMDVSASMLAADMPPSRLAKAKSETANLIDLLKGDRIGLVVFAGEAYVQCPLTLDYSAAKMFLSDIDYGSVPRPGSALGEGIRKAIGAFVEKERKYKVLILISDGEETGDSDPMKAAEEARRAGVVMYTIGIGTPSGEPIPVRNAAGQVIGYKKDDNGQVVMSRLDEAGLQEAALKTGGKYYRATAGELELDKIFDDISKMERKELTGQFMARWEERFRAFLAAAFALLGVEFLLNERRRRRAETLSAATYETVGKKQGRNS